MSALPRIQDALRAAAEHFELPPRTLRSTGRAPIVARARQIGAAIAHAETGRSSREIARVFGLFDHTAVLYAIRQVEKRSGEDGGFRADVEAVRSKLLLNFEDWQAGRGGPESAPALPDAHAAAVIDVPPEKGVTIVQRAAVKVARAYQQLEAARETRAERACLDQLVAAACKLNDCMAKNGGRL